MLDGHRALFTDLGRAYHDEPDMIMAQIREESVRGG